MLEEVCLNQTRKNKVIVKRTIGTNSIDKEGIVVPATRRRVNKGQKNSNNREDSL